MFIPEIGTNIVLTEKFVFTNNNRWSSEDEILEIGTKLSVKKIVIKSGRSYSNQVQFRVLKCKANKDCKLYNQVIYVGIYDLNEMEFEIVDCNEETKKALLQTMEDIQNFTKGLNSNYRKIESVLLNGKNLISFSPQKPPLSFFRDAVNRLEKRRREYENIMSYDKIYAIVNKNFRKNKIAELLKESLDV